MKLGRQGSETYRGDTASGCGQTAVGHVADISEGLLRIDSDVIHIIGETIMKKQNKTINDSCRNGHCKMIDQTRP